MFIKLFKKTVIKKLQQIVIFLIKYIINKKPVI